MRTIKKSMALMATALLGAATLQAGQVNGNVNFIGTANLDTASAATATAVTA